MKAVPPAEEAIAIAVVAGVAVQAAVPEAVREVTVVAIPAAVVADAEEDRTRPKIQQGRSDAALNFGTPCVIDILGCESGSLKQRKWQAPSSRKAFAPE